MALEPSLPYGTIRLCASVLAEQAVNSDLSVPGHCLQLYTVKQLFGTSCLRLNSQALSQ